MLNVYADPEYRALYAACFADYAEGTGWAALRDWLRDRGVPEVVVQEAEPLRRLSPYDVVSFLDGSGSGIGRGSGSGSGIGRGSGIGSGQENQMEPGKAYLVHCGDWHTFVGRCVRQVGPMTYLFEFVSKILETNNGDCWEKLAAGDGRLRKACSYAHYTTPACVPLAIIAFEWQGPTPQEA